MIDPISSADVAGRLQSAGCVEPTWVRCAAPDRAVRHRRKRSISRRCSRRAALSAIDTLKAGEAAAIAGMQGKASVQQVVEAVMSAEQTLQSAIAVRDKVVAAYLELSRMQI